MVVPAIFSMSVFTVWLALLWTSYELAAQPSSSLLAGTVSSLSFSGRSQSHDCLCRNK